MSKESSPNYDKGDIQRFGSGKPRLKLNRVLRQKPESPYIFSENYPGI